MRILAALVVVTASLAETPARAEVSDKMLIVDHRIDPWIWPGLLCAVALALELKWPLSGLLTVPLTAFLAWGTYLEFTDPSVGPAILSELGQGYVTASWLALGFALVFPVALTIGLSRRRTKP